MHRQFSIVLFIVFCFCSWESVWSHENGCKQVAERLFASDIPPYFRSQVKVFVLSNIKQYPLIFELISQKKAPATAYQKRTIEWFRLLQEAPQTNGQAERQWHQRFIGTWRELTVGEKEAVSPLSRQIAAFLDAFSFWIFSQVDLSHAYVASFEKEIGLKRLDNVAQADLKIAPLLSTIYSSQQNVPSYTGYCKVDYLTDTLMEGNMPSLVVRYQNGPKMTHVMRVGTMVIDVSHSKTFAIDEGFTYYLKAAAKLGKKHLYVNSARRGKPRVKKDEIEIGRTKLLESMEADAEFAPSFRIITLDKNSDFYFQEGDYSELKESSQFKKQFLLHLFDESVESKFYWSAKLKGPLWTDRVKSIVERVHQSHFSQKSELSADERRAFIEIAYVLIVEAAIQQLDIDVANVSCHYCVDRGASLLGLFYFYNLMQPSKQISGLDLSKMMAYTFGPGIFLHNRPIHDYRVSILETAASHIRN